MGSQPSTTALSQPVKIGASLRLPRHVIDWHGDHLNLEKAKPFFAEMATKYGKYPNIIYEVFNEPAEETWPEGVALRVAP
jgi:Cellulase (glycosyl hydrolase family 5)